MSTASKADVGGASSDPDEEAPVVELRAVTRVYGKGDGEVRALDGIDFRVRRGEFVALMGASGSGKSTCLNLLGCLDTPSSGEYRFHGVDVARLDDRERALVRRHHLGFVFQGFHLLARTSAIENVELPLVYRGLPAAERRTRARAALARVGLADRETHVPSELSGGQQQRVAIARALVTEPTLILADEPTGNLDSAKTDEIVRLLQELHASSQVTIVMVTHEPDVGAAADRIVTFKDGRIVRDAPSPRLASAPDAPPSDAPPSDAPPAVATEPRA